MVHIPAACLALPDNVPDNRNFILDLFSFAWIYEEILKLKHLEEIQNAEL